MGGRPRFALLAGAVTLAVTAAVVAVPVEAGAATPGVTTVDVRGTLVVAQSDGPDGGSTSYAVQVADGDLVPVSGDLPPDAETGAAFHGRLAVPAAATGPSAAGRASLAEPRRTPLRIVGTPSLTDPTPAAAATSTAHQQFVAALDNKGALGQNDAALLAHVSTVGAYWEGESNGAIASIGVPATVKHYDTTVATTDCGLGSDFFSLVSEAQAKFPSVNPFGGSDQLVLFVPDACASGGVVGEATVGSTFASGGVLIVKAGTAIDGTYAHETGHNYGFAHANARWAGTSNEYYGIYDVMGFALANVNQLTALSTPFRVFQGITDPGEIQDVPLGDKTQAVHATATIQPRSGSTGLRSVRVVDPDSGEPLYLDYRSGTGKDARSAYALTGSLGSFQYSPGVVITAARDTSGVDDLVLDAAGHTSLHAGGAWTNASGSLTVSVTSTGAAGAAVSVDYTPSTQDFTSVGTPVIGGTVTVGGTVTLDTGTWSPAATSTSIRWTAGGTPVPNTDDKTSFVAGPALAGKQLVATVTGFRTGLRSANAVSAAVTVASGTIPVTANPTVTGTVQVGSTLQGHTGAWGSLLSPVSSTWQWRSGGTDIPGATSLTYVVQPGDVGAQLSLAQRLTATGYTATTIVSADTGVVPAPVISPAPVPTVSGTPRVGQPLQAAAGTWMAGTTLTYQWSVGGSTVPGATGSSYTPKPADLGGTLRVAVTGSKPGYPDVTTTSADTTAVRPGTLTTSRPTIGGKLLVGRTLTAKPGTWTAGTTFAYAWFADGVAIKHATAKRLVLAKAQRGKRITVKVTGTHPGYTSRALTSARTTRIA